jgi:zinc transport system substrate-binding protein
MQKKKILLLAIISILLFAACGNKTIDTIEQKDNKSEKIVVAASIVPEETFIKAVGGDFVEVVTMIPPGNSPSNYEPTPMIMEKFSEAQMYFTIGVPTEKANILPKANELNDSMKIINLQNEVEKNYKMREFAPGERDPHIWLSPKRVVVMINTIKEQLSLIDPEHKDTYEKNSLAYIEKLKKMSGDIKESLKNLDNKTFIVYHPSFGYFADDYGMEMITIENEGKEATIKDIEAVIDLAKEKNIKVVFYQSEIDNSQVKIIAEEINGKAQMISPLASNYIENLESIADTFRKAAAN